MVTKSSIRGQRKDENEQMFEQLASEYIDSPEDHFLEVEIPITKPGAIKELLTMNDLIKMCSLPRTYGPWPPSCLLRIRACPYMDLCRVVVCKTAFVDVGDIHRRFAGQQEQRPHERSLSLSASERTGRACSCAAAACFPAVP